MMDDSKADSFPAGQDLSQKISCVNENGPECFVKVVVRCRGPHVALEVQGKYVWESVEEELAGRSTPGRRSHDFHVPLLLTNGGKQRAKEKLVIEVFMRRRACKELIREGEFQHSIWVEPAT